MPLAVLDLDHSVDLFLTVIRRLYDAQD